METHLEKLLVFAMLFLALNDSLAERVILSINSIKKIL